MRSFVELEGRGDFLERGELGAAPLTSGSWLDREGSWISQAPPLGDVGEERLDSLLAFEGWEKESSLPPSAGWKKREILGRLLLILAPVTSQSPAGGHPDTGAERNKGLLNFGRENILLQAQESPPGGGKMFWECLGTPADFQAQPTQKREIHSAEEHELHIPEEEGRRSSRRGSTRKSAACPVQRPKTA
ncbi:unnamed protein product [Pleuronectes platessa]|uniref:Uncharacterized protein n=1 Tax=Pleuronectes platessa TaxID=8262 RepID=A0A9N7UJW2_PLEPL|nr:unnamed protein product [Pleuronectes platessa]